MDDSRLALRLMLVEFVAASYANTRQVRLLKSAADLGPALLRIADRTQLQGGVWIAWSGDGQTHFVAAEDGAAGRTRNDSSCLRTSMYDDDGRLAADAIWVRETGGRWRLCGR